jgi:hypothetical protein
MGVMQGYLHRVSAAALRSRGLLRISGRGPTWRAELTDTGRAVVADFAQAKASSDSNGKAMMEAHRGVALRMRACRHGSG